MDKPKMSLLRIIVGILAIAFILFLWIKKDILSIITNMPSEQILPLIVTTIAVSLCKVIALAALILLCKWIISKVKK